MKAQEKLPRWRQKWIKGKSVRSAQILNTSLVASSYSHPKVVFKN